MDYRPYILAGTFLLLIVAMVTFVATLVRARRQPMGPVHGYASAELAAPADQAQTIDTDLGGLELTVDSDAPSAALLTPLRTGEWMPPEAPAPAENLPALSLDERIAGFEPGPAVPEPSFAVESYQAWEVGPEAEAPVVPAPAAAPDWTAAVPPVGEDEAAGEADEFGAEIQALLPTVDLPAAEQLESEPQPEAVELELTQMLTALDLSHVEPSLEAAPVAALPEPAPDLVDGSLAVAAVAGVIEPESEPEADAQPTEDVHEWVDMLRETQGPVAPRPLAVAPPAAPRPAVSVASAAPPVEPPVQSSPVVPQRPVRPSARVHGVAADEPVTAERPERLAPAPRAARSRGDVEDIVMAAPVEMWFGEARVGVKAGTATYERFRKYADVLLDDLKAHRPPSR